ncbi:MAG TPA: hypothetical protein VF178_10550 [Gemmatimonadaceae bacterium]
MPRTIKVYLPRWLRWLLLPVLLLVWGIVTYETFVGDAGESQMSVVAWLGVTALLLLVGVMLWLMTAGRLPAYVVEVEDTNDSPPS